MPVARAMFDAYFKPAKAEVAADRG
jgi:hypothetical protein